MNNSPKLAILGAGAMARYHVDAALRVGFSVTDLAARPDSSRARILAEEFQITNCWDNGAQMISRGSWDAIVIAVDVPATLNLAVMAASTGRPVLVEKPVAVSSTHLQQAADSLVGVHVAYNRRFYPSSQAAREFVQSHRPTQVLATIPESFAHGDPDRGCGVRYNSVHVFDLLRFICGDLEVQSVFAPGETLEDRGRIGIFRGIQGDLCAVNANWNSPSNFSISIDGGGERFEMRPLEIASIYRGMEVYEPTPQVPIRSYHPKVEAEIPIDPLSSRFKPGFVPQMQAFFDVVALGAPEGDLASIPDAIAALQIAEKLIDP